MGEQQMERDVYLDDLAGGQEGGIACQMPPWTRRACSHALRIRGSHAAAQFARNKTAVLRDPRIPMIDRKHDVQGVPGGLRITWGG